MRFLEEERVWRLRDLLYADDFVLCSESDDDVKVIVGCFVEMGKRRGLKVNVDKSKGMVLCGE